MTINNDANSLQIDSEYIELYDFDATYITDKNGVSGTVTYLTPTATTIDVNGISTLKWRGNVYTPFPFEITGYQHKCDGTAPTRPTLAVSNVNQFFMAAALSLGDLVGMKITRWRTFYKYTDNGSTPNNQAYFPIDEHIVVRKLPSALKTSLSWELANALDRPGLKLPRRQILRDLGFPGVSRVRVR